MAARVTKSRATEASPAPHSRLSGRYPQRKGGGVSSPKQQEEAEASTYPQCERDPLCTRGYKHGGRGGDCAARDASPLAPSPEVRQCGTPGCSLPAYHPGSAFTRIPHVLRLRITSQLRFRGVRRAVSQRGARPAAPSRLSEGTRAERAAAAESARHSRRRRGTRTRTHTRAPLQPSGINPTLPCAPHLVGVSWPAGGAPRALEASAPVCSCPPCG